MRYFKHLKDLNFCYISNLPVAEMVLPIRVLMAKQILRRTNQAFAAGLRQSSTTEYGKTVEFHHEKRIKLPLVTMDDIPVPQFPAKELYDKEQMVFNRIMIAGIAFFLFTIGMMYYDDTLEWEKHLMPKSYRERKIYPRSDFE
uniref:Deltamethrin resistance protein prag01 domain-containing protein n=1 Tax=Romanomermis culicivorax TaxID=13658 RepID=A0A915KLC6_ROMCU